MDKACSVSMAPQPLAATGCLVSNLGILRPRASMVWLPIASHSLQLTCQPLCLHVTLRWDPAERITPEQALQHPWFVEHAALLEAAQAAAQAAAAVEAQAQQQQQQAASYRPSPKPAAPGQQQQVTDKISPAAALQVASLAAGSATTQQAVAGAARAQQQQVTGSSGGAANRAAQPPVGSRQVAGPRTPQGLAARDTTQAGTDCTPRSGSLAATSGASAAGVGAGSYAAAPVAAVARAPVVEALMNSPVGRVQLGAGLGGHQQQQKALAGALDASYPKASSDQVLVPGAAIAISAAGSKAGPGQYLSEGAGMQGLANGGSVTAVQPAVVKGAGKSAASDASQQRASDSPGMLGRLIPQLRR